MIKSKTVHQFVDPRIQIFLEQCPRLRCDREQPVVKPPTKIPLAAPEARKGRAYDRNARPQIPKMPIGKPSNRKVKDPINTIGGIGDCRRVARYPASAVSASRTQYEVPERIAPSLKS